jgi:hypothetical protein
VGEINIERLAAAYKRLVLWFGAQLLVTPYWIGVRFVLGESLTAHVLRLVGCVAGFVALAALAYYGYRTAAALGSEASWMWAVATFVPCVSAVTLLILSQKATHACDAQGIRVGLLGPRLARLKGKAAEQGDEADEA